MEKKMNKVLGLVLVMISIASHCYAADQWSKTLSGSSQAADIDSNVTTSWTAQDRMLAAYRQGAAVIRNSASTLTVLSGEMAIPDSSASTVRYRKNTSSTTVTWSDLDTGVEATSTQYYVYSLADTDATTFTAKISTSSSAPSGATYYRKIAEFYNDSSGNITNVISYRADNGSDNRDISKAWINFNGSTNTVNNSYNVSSITDNGTGDYTITFTTSFADAYYSCVGSANTTGEDQNLDVSVKSQATGSVRVRTAYGSDNVPFDSTSINVACFGDRT